MDCETFNELSGAYVLAALPDSEMREAREHASTCDRHPELRDFAIAVAGLMRAAPDMAPPPALKSRIMAGISDEGDARERRAGAMQRVLGWLGEPRLAYGVSAALAVLVVALLAWSLSLQGDGATGMTVADLSGAANGRLVYLEEEALAVVELRGIDVPPAGRAYQVWAIRGDQPASLGLLDVGEPGDVKAVFSADLSGVDVIAVTIEPSGGSDSPTTEPIIAGELS